MHLWRFVYLFIQCCLHIVLLSIHSCGIFLYPSVFICTNSISVVVLIFMLKYISVYNGIAAIILIFMPYERLSSRYLCLMSGYHSHVYAWAVVVLIFMPYVLMCTNNMAVSYILWYSHYYILCITWLAKSKIKAYKELMYDSDISQH